MRFEKIILDWSKNANNVSCTNSPMTGGVYEAKTKKLTRWLVAKYIDTPKQVVYCSAQDGNRLFIIVETLTRDNPHGSLSMRVVSTKDYEVEIKNPSPRLDKVPFLCEARLGIELKYENPPRGDNSNTSNINSIPPERAN